METWVNETSNLVFMYVPISISKKKKKKKKKLADILSGDSCHPMLPYLAQGANSSLEDGAVLGHLLGSTKSKAELPRILRLYESLRKSRGEAIVQETFKQVRFRRSGYGMVRVTG